MTGRRTSHPIKELWTGLLTLLLFSAAVQSESALNVTGAPKNGAIIEEPSGNSTTRKIEPIVESTLTSLRQNIDESPEVTLEAVEKIVLNSTSKSEGSQTQSEPVIKTENLKVPEAYSKIKKVEVKRLVKESLPEFIEKEDSDEIRELDENDSREPTTPRTKKGVDEDESSEKENKDEIDKKNPENNFSFVNDTNVNYITKKVIKGAKDDGIYEKDYKNIKTTLENPTNVIASGDDQPEKPKGPKSQVELIKNTTLPKILRFSEENVETKDEKHLEFTTLKTLPIDKIKIDDLTSTEIPDDKNNDNKTLQTPRARTISFGGTNEFVNGLNKTGDSRRIVEATNSPVVTEITEKPIEEEKVDQEKSFEEQKSTSLKPYPYLKINQVDLVSSNATTSAISLSGDPVIPESTEEISALENTIGQNKEDKNIVVTESSVVIDNSIQQFKPTYPKRSGNLSRTSSSLEPIFSTSPSSLPDETKRIETTESIGLENSTTLFAGNLRVSNAENDVPRGNDESTSIETKETSGSLDLTGNGITEMMETEKKNHSSLVIENSVAKTTTVLPSDGNATARVTEINLLVQNTTEKMATFSDESAITNVDVETEVDDSMLKISTLNVTEDSTKIPTTETPSVTTILPEISTMSSKVTSSIFSSTKIEEQTTTASPRRLENIFTKETMETEGFSTPETSMDSTTSNIEYEFVGLTDGGVSQKHIASTESSNVLTEENVESASAASFPNLESSTPSLISFLSTPSPTTMEIETTMENLETSTYPGTSITEMESNEDSTTIYSILDSSEPEETTFLLEETDEPTTINDFLPTETNEFETTTEIIPEDVTNFTRVTDILPDMKNLTDSGRSGVSSTSMPEISTSLGNFDETLVVSTESSNLSNVTESSEITVTSRNSFEVSPSSISSMEITTTSIELESITDSSSTSENPINVVTSNTTGPGNRAVSPEDLTSLVRIIFEGNWADVCPHLSALRQSLADLLTSGLEKTVLANQIIFQKNPCTDGSTSSMVTTELSVTTILLYVVDKNGNFDAEMTKLLPTLYSRSPIKLQVTIHSFQLVQDADSGNAIAVVVVSCVAFICLVLLAGLLFIMRKRQTRFNYGERCRPVSLDAYSLDSVSAYNSVRGRKGAVRASKRSYGNPTFEDSTATPSHPLNFAGLSTFSNEENTIAEEFTGIPQVTARIDELPQGAEIKNRYANVVPLPETRVSLMKINDDPLTEYINASYVRGPKNATKYYIACQAPMESTVTDFWRMIWEQQTKVVIMLTDLVENGVEKCAEYLPPSEVTDCHRLFGDFQVTLKKRETKEKYAISTLHLKNLENNTFREVSHIWYLWPANGVQSDAAGLIAVLLEARALQRGGPGPVVVHCSPGTGRTGTLIALDLGIRQYEITRTVDVPRVVYTIRRDRAGAVQTKEQYAFIYKALNLYATKLAGGALES